MEAEAQALDLQAEKVRGGAPGAFVTGASGRSEGQNCRSARALGVTVENAKRSIALHAEARLLRRRADAIENSVAQLRKLIGVHTVLPARRCREALFDGSLDNRLLAGHMSACVVLADRGLERGGDYRCLAGLSYDSLGFRYTPECPDYGRSSIERWADWYRERRNQSIGVTKCGQSVVLGSALDAA